MHAYTVQHTAKSSLMLAVLGTALIYIAEWLAEPSGWLPVCEVSFDSLPTGTLKRLPRLLCSINQYAVA